MDQIYAYVRTRPMASAGEILREWQRRFPERFMDAHLSTLQRRLREMRASLVASQAEPGGGQMDSATESCTSSELPPVPEDTSPLADALSLIVSGPAPAPSFRPPPEKKLPPVPDSLTSDAKASLSKGVEKNQHALTTQEPFAVNNADSRLSSMMTIDHAISLFLQGKHTHDWELKTREWHETSLGQLQRYVSWRKILLLPSLTSSEIREWLTFLRTETLVTGMFRVQSTISTYARSVHAFCVWLVEQGFLEQSPFARMSFPQGKKRRLRIIEQETIERFLDACYAPPQTKRAIMASATARNRAILWVLWDTGLLVSEMCALNLGDMDLTQGTLHVRGRGPKGRSLPLTPEVQQALTVYLEQYRLRAGKRGASDPLFLSEQQARLTKNGFTQLFHRLCARAGFEDRRLTPMMLREMFAIRFLQTGGPPKALRRLLGVAKTTPIKRYLDAAGCSRRQRETSDTKSG